MFHIINNKKRFAIENTELSLILFNDFFYKKKDITSFEIILPKIKLDPEDEFYRNHRFQREGELTAIIIPDFKKSFFLHIKKILTTKLLKMLKLTCMIKNINNSTIEIDHIYNLHYYYFNTNNNFYKRVDIKSQSLNFFFFKKLHEREFFKKKVQVRNHTFNKSIVNIDIFSKKRNHLHFSFVKTFEKSNTSLEKVNNTLVFNVTNQRNFKKQTVFKYTFNLLKNKVYTNNNFSWTVYTNTLITKKISKNSLFKLVYKKLYNINVIKQNNQFFYKNVFIYNLLKLITKRNNYLTNELTNITTFSNFKNFLNEDTKKTSNYLPNFENKYVMNNFLPYYNFFVKRKFYTNVLLRNILNPSFSLYYSFYLFNFLEVFLQKKIWLKVNTKANSVIKGKLEFFINDVFRKNRNYQNSVGRHFYLLEFLEILYISFYYRDLKFLSYWFKKTMEKLHLKKHRKLIKVIQNILKNNLEFLNLLNVQGFTMDVRGKLGTTGNSKKKHYAFTIGTMSPTSKNHDMSMNQTTVRTNTGVLGVIMTLSY